MNGREWVAQPEQTSVSGSVMLNVHTPVLKMLSSVCEMDHMYASVTSNDQRGVDLEHLRLMMSLKHLELIQFQADQLAQKDKVIAELKRQIDALRMRCERITRRVTLQQRHEDSNPNSNQLQLPSQHPTNPAEPIDTTQTSARTNPAKLPANNLNVDNNRLSIVSGQIASPGKKRRSSSTTSVSAASARRKRRVTSSGSAGKTEADRKPILSTPNEYYTVIGEGDLTWKPLELRVPPKHLKENEMVQVPSWREKHFTPLYVIEGTENLEDEVFLKRHQKLEHDERRRKRWDIQRIREQTICERLKQRVSRSSSKGNNAKQGGCHVSSFFGNPDDIQDVSIDSKLPVVAFGMPLRVIEATRNFTVPWTYISMS